MEILRSVKRTLAGRAAAAPVTLDPQPADPILEALPVIGSVEALQRHACRIAASRHPDLDWAEFGVSVGTSARVFLEELGPHNRLYLFDSWEGLPEAWEKIEAGRFRCPVPSFADGRAHLVRGLFAETVSAWAATQRAPLAFLHMDADLYSSTLEVLLALDALIVPGTVILFDEFYNYEGWIHHEHKAFLEYLEKKDRGFGYLGKSDKHRSFPDRERVTSPYVRVCTEITE
jgi:predicted O-methyltransferase YrrM